MKTFQFLISSCIVALALTARAQEWKAENIGTTDKAGVTVSNKGEFTIKAGGSDIWDSADTFHYIYTSAMGDVELVARVMSLDELHEWTQVGLMIRADNKPGSRHVYVDVTSQHGVAWKWRLEDDGVSDTRNEFGEYTFPNAWIRLVKKGNECSAYWSTDGKKWEQIGEPQEIELPKTFLIGIATCGHVEGSVTTTKLDNIKPMPVLKK